jgi:hypothetical protein
MLIPILILIYIHMCTYKYCIHIYLYQETPGQAAEGHHSLRQGRSCTISARPISPLQTLPPGVCVCVCVCVCVYVCVCVLMGMWVGAEDAWVRGREDAWTLLSTCFDAQR